MASRSGNWFTGYQGRTTYTPFYVDPQQQPYKMPGFGDLWSQTWQGMEKDRSGIGADWSRQQQELANMLFSRARGEAPSAAERQMQAGLGQYQKQQNAQAASMAGVNPALAQRMAMQAGQGAAMDVMQQQGILRAQEQAQAEASLGGLLGQARGQDMATQQMVEQLQLDYLRQGYTQAEAERQAQMEWDRRRMEQMNIWQQMMLQRDMANAGMMNQGGWGQALLSGATTLGAAAIP